MKVKETTFFSTYCEVEEVELAQFSLKNKTNIFYGILQMLNFYN